jgi:hypothetical protein
MAATYPEMFKAATAYSGVPAGCFVSTANQEAAWNSTCAQGTVQASAQYWANTVKAMYPGYTGARPRFQVYHGSTDAILRPQNYQETVKEWTGVFGFDATKPAKTQANFPAQNYKTDTWGVTTANPLGTVQGIYVTGVGHTVPIQGYVEATFWFIVVYEIVMLTLCEQYPRHEVVRSRLSASYTTTGSLLVPRDVSGTRLLNGRWTRLLIRGFTKLCGQARQIVVVDGSSYSQRYRVRSKGSSARFVSADRVHSSYSTRTDQLNGTNTAKTSSVGWSD